MGGSTQLPDEKRINGDDHYPDQHESLHNVGEAKLVASIYHHYRTVIGVPDEDIGIISPY